MTDYEREIQNANRRFIRDALVCGVCMLALLGAGALAFLVGG